MDRRAFLFGLCGAGAAVAGAATLAPLLIDSAEAAPLDMLKAMPATGLKPDPTPEPGDGAEVYGTAPDGTPAESTYWVWRNGRRVWIPPRRRRVCRRVWTRWGWRTRCWWR